MSPSETTALAPDSLAAHSGVVSESEQKALRADIRRLSTMLGRTLSDEAGPEVLELVEKVRRAARDSARGEAGPDVVAALLDGIDTGTAVLLARAFSQYFQLANVAEQLHRSRELRELRPADARPLRAVLRRLATEADPDEVADVLARAELRPVFTAHRPSRPGSRCWASCAGSWTRSTPGRPTRSSPPW